ncbi:pyridoxamine 5'-phosphate oxidase family protein [Lichenicola sp.]|uniref:pyridoxamine 5'-phosphate oxidase family protein n=1 Tax=Lichenicola sp. TaxID=2804529 RepID=UPI003AFFB210
MDQDQIDKLWEMMKSTKFAMLTTEDGDDLRARPMAASQDSFDGTLWFFTSASSHKVDEVGSDHRVGVTYADPKLANYVSMSGKATLVQDRATIDAHWSEILTTWFPNGKDDPDVALLRIEVTKAEYWDAPNSKMVHAYGYLKAKLTGTPPAGGENKKVSLD